MSKNIFVWSSNQYTAQKVAEEFENTGNNIFCASGDVVEEIKNYDSMDILVLCPAEKLENDGEIGTNHDYEKMMEVIDENVNGTKNCLEKFIPLLEKGKTKRIALITKKIASVSANTCTYNFAEQMSLSSLNMMISTYFNILRSQGFSFRCFCADGEKGISTSQYVLMDYCNRPTYVQMLGDEDRFTMRDKNCVQVPW